MSDKMPGGRGPEDELFAIPKLAEAIGVTPRVLRYWEEQGLISPTEEHGRLRYSPRDRAIGRLLKFLLDRGESVDGLRMLKALAQRDARLGAAAGQEHLARVALELLYARKAFREATATDEEHFPEPPPGRKPPPGGAGRRHARP